MPATRPSTNTGSPVKLKFDDKLTGRGLSSEALQRKLKNLLDELVSITESEPENIDLATFATVRKDLIGTSLLLHKDKGVKAYTACCIAELLNIYAPDAPYTAPELKDIFQFFFRQLSSGLKGQDAPYYQLYHDLLSSLSRTKSCVLICDLPQAEEMMTEVFKDFMNLASQGLPQPIELYMTDIMVALLDESQSAPSEVVEILIAHFNTKKSVVSSPMFRITVDVCNAAADKLIRPVCQYFTDIIVQHRYSDAEGEEDEEDNRDFEAIRAAHTLVKRIHKYCPKLLMNVIPQLQEEMGLLNTQIRLLATQTLGDMFAHVQYGSELMRDYRTTWVTWIARKNDKTPAIRLAFIEAAKRLIGNTDMQHDVGEAMKLKAMDPEEKIRAAVCKALGELDYETAAYHVSEELLRVIANRCLDKRNTVRVEAFDAIGKLYSLATPEIERGNTVAIAQFGWIPTQLFEIAAMPDVKVLAEDIIARYILPLPPFSPKEDVDEDMWTRRLLAILSSGRTTVFDSVILMSALNHARPTPYHEFVESCLENNGGTINNNEVEVTTRLHRIAKLIASRFPNALKVEEDLIAFAKHHDRRLYKYLKTAMDPQTNLSGLVKARHEFIKVVEKDIPSLSTTMQIFFRRASLWLINPSSIPTLLDIVSTSRSPGSPGKASRNKKKTQSASQVDETVDVKLMDVAQRLLLFIAKSLPELFYSHLPRLAKEVHANNTAVSLEASLRALASVARLGTDQHPNDQKLDSVMIKTALGGDRAYAKYAARYLSNSKEKDKSTQTLVDKLATMLPKADDEHIVAHVAALAELARYMPATFEEKSEDIVRFLFKDLVHRPVEQDSMDIDNADEVEWCTKEQLHPLVIAKCGVMRLLVNRCLAHTRGDDAEKVSQPVAKLLMDVLDGDGSFTPYEGDEVDRDRLKDMREGGAPSRSHIRLKAAKCLLRLAQEKSLLPPIISRLPSLALVAQDFCWEVRSLFITKLTILLSSNKLQPVFNTIVFLTCHDVETNILQRAKNYVLVQQRKLNPKQRLIFFDIIFVRYLHLLAHHPDFEVSENEEGLPALAKYVGFFVELVANADNVSLLYHLAQQCKTVRDNAGHTFSERLYLLSELAEYVIKQRAQELSWTIPAYPERVHMPMDIFKSLPPETVKEIRKTVYLTDEMIEWIIEMEKARKSAQPKARKRRAKAETKAKRPAKRKKKNDTDSEDQEDESDDEEISSVAEPPAPTVDESMSEDSESDANGTAVNPDLGRGARSRAKAKALHRGRKYKKHDG
ncbi:hypothetical protein FRC14_002423 [Serendipita sp. 396]|nr:hypothetical protein FRC14_002423 [Serendipita sp. 396]KAG8799754.1 hypothetical protein FRC16_004419 [Serendipita sp. 398]